MLHNHRHQLVTPVLSSTFVRRSILLVIAWVLLCALSPWSARADAASTSFPFGAVPVQKGSATASSYFSLSVPAGGSAQEAITVTNYSTTSPLQLKLGASSGQTDTNSGYAYSNAFGNGNCSGAACWIRGLPTSVTVPAGGHLNVKFTVSVPGGTASGQYLAGVTMEPAVQPTQTTTSSGSLGAGATVVHEISVGVAVTVGDATSLKRSLTITGVSGTTVGSTPRLLIAEQNTGQMFVSAKGDTVCAADGKTYTFKVVSLTILPGDSATLDVNTPGLPVGSPDKCAVKLNYKGAATADWGGSVTVPVPHVTKLVHVKPGEYAAIPKAKVKKSVPTWAFAAGAVVVAALIAAIIALVLILNGGAAGGGATGGGTGGGLGGGGGAGGAGGARAGSLASEGLTALEVAGGGAGVAGAAAAAGVVGRQVAGEPVAEEGLAAEQAVPEPAAERSVGEEILAGAKQRDEDEDEEHPVLEPPAVPHGTPLPWTDPQGERANDDRTRNS